MSQHIVPRKVYFAVFGALMVVTAITTAVAIVDLGPWNTVVALGIAFFQATLVVLFFMHEARGGPLAFSGPPRAGNPGRAPSGPDGGASETAPAPARRAAPCLPAS